MLFESKFDPCTDFTTGNPLIESFLDSDGAGFKPARKSTTSGVIVIGSRVACHSVRNQKCVSLSSCEAEYLAMAAVTSETTLSQKVRLFSDKDKTCGSNVGAPVGCRACSASQYQGFVVTDVHQAQSF